jgi:hypothetical protein
LLARCEDLTEKHQIGIFTAGLHNPVRTEVELKHPATLQDVMALVRAYEQRLTMSGDTPPHAPTSRSSSYHAPSKPLLLPKPAATTGNKDTSSALLPPASCLKRLTPAEMVAKRERDECYNCTEPFSCEHLKVCPMKGIFLLQMDDDMKLDDMAVTEDPHISLHAISGLSNATIMQLAVRNDVDMLCALVNSGSTHSFISVTTACRLHMYLVPVPGLHVSMANKDCVTGVGVCRTMRLFIDKEEIIINLFIIPLEGYDRVLSTHWLRTLGPILWDFEQGHMSCWRDDHRVVWMSMTPQSRATVVHALDAIDPMPLLLQEFTGIFDTLTGLPLPRSLNHRIHLLPGTTPIAVRPYQYP